MSEVPVSWLSYSEVNPARGRWDQAFLERILDGEEWRVAGGSTFKTIPWDPDDGRGRVIIFPCGHYIESGARHIAASMLARDLKKLPWAVVIATSDESDSFEWNKFDLPSHVRLWVQTARPESTYPEGTFFYPLGSPTSPKEWGGPHDKTIDVFFAGQANHVRRDECVTALMKLHMQRPDLNVEVLPTEGFTLGLPLDEYQDRMRASKIVPCPSGICSQESFRLYEALEAGAFPIVDAFRPDGSGRDFWKLLFDLPFPAVRDWKQFDSGYISTDPRLRAVASAWWQQYKRSIVYRLESDVMSVAGLWALPPTSDRPEDRITVVVVTSPMPSNPSTAIIEETIASVKERLPGAEIHLLIDGVREEQHHRADDYWEYVRRLVGTFNADPTVVPYVHTSHHHQAVMFRHALNRIRTEFVMFVEHDAPLVGDIDFDEVLTVMARDDLVSMRFLHETAVPPGSEGLFVDLERTADRPYLRTIQWSQRPHVARTDWYRDLMATYFGWESRTMIEDVMHGVVQHRHVGGPTAILKGWNHWRLCVWAPEENMQHSAHLDGRGDDPKYGMKIAYDSKRPRGAPPEGIIE